MRRHLLAIRLWITFGLLFAGLTCSGLGRISINQTATSQIARGSLLELLATNLGFGDFAAMDLAQNQELANQGVSRNQITTVFVADFSLDITAPASGQDFTFIDALEFYVESEGLERVRIAHGGPFPQNQTSVELDIDPDVDIAPYVAAPSMTITTTATGHHPQNDTTIEASVTFDVGFDVGGALCGGAPASGGG